MPYMPAEVVKLRIGNLAKAVLVTGQSYQDPKDALNEFVSNAADEYAQAAIVGGRIRILLQRQGRHPLIAISDDGRGLDPARLRQIAQNLFESTKVGDDRVLGEKAIGLLAFQQICSRCEIVSRPEGSSDSYVLRLNRGTATASLDIEKRRSRDHSGTTVYLADVDPEVGRVLTQHRIVEYLRRRRAAALARGDYVIEVASGRSVELVTPEKPDGIRLDIPPRNTLWGRIEFALFVAPRPDHKRRVAVVGRAGTTILDSVTELEEFDHAPWNSDQVGGQIIFEALAQSAGRRAILRDRDAFPLLVDAVASVEPAVTRTLERIGKDLDEATADRISEMVRRIFGRVLRELADLDNPMRTLVGTEPGDDGLLAETLVPEMGKGSRLTPEGNAAPTDEPIPDVSWPSEQGPAPEPPLDVVDGQTAAAARRTRHLPTIEPDPTPGHGRSRFDAENGVVPSRTTMPPWSTTSPPSWRRSTSYTTTLALQVTRWPRRWCACWCVSAGTSGRDRAKAASRRAYWLRGVVGRTPFAANVHPEYHAHLE